MASTPALALIYSTHPSLAQARKTARAVLKEELAACCNLFADVESHYVWEGKPAKAREVVMLSKTTTKHAAAVMKRIKALHPYDTPAILQLPATASLPAFARWVKETCG
jgi:periplasmic divalent cation tolerance protein